MRVCICSAFVAGSGVGRGGGNLGRDDCGRSACFGNECKTVKRAKLISKAGHIVFRCYGFRAPLIPICVLKQKRSFRYRRCEAGNRGKTRETRLQR